MIDEVAATPKAHRRRKSFRERVWNSEYLGARLLRKVRQDSFTWAKLEVENWARLLVEQQAHEQDELRAEIAQLKEANAQLRAKLERIRELSSITSILSTYPQESAPT